MFSQQFQQQLRRVRRVHLPPPPAERGGQPDGQHGSGAVGEGGGREPRDGRRGLAEQPRDHAARAGLRGGGGRGGGGAQRGAERQRAEGHRGCAGGAGAGAGRLSCCGCCCCCCCCCGAGSASDHFLC